MKIEILISQLYYSSKEASTDDNHNSKANAAGKSMETRSLTSKGSNSGSEDERSVTTAVDANMASEEEADPEVDESMKDC